MNSSTLNTNTHLSSERRLPSVAATDVQLTVDTDQRIVRGALPVNCRPEAIYTVWADVAGWSGWDPDTRWARLDGPFAAGSRGRIAPQKGFPVSFELTHRVSNRAFTIVCPVLGNRMTFVHSMDYLDGQLMVSHSVQFSGWLSGLLMRQVGSDVARGLPLTLTRLRARCEG